MEIAQIKKELIYQLLFFKSAGGEEIFLCNQPIFSWHRSLRRKHFIVLLLIGLRHPVLRLVFIFIGISFKVFSKNYNRFL